MRAAGAGSPGGGFGSAVRAGGLGRLLQVDDLLVSLVFHVTADGLCLPFGCPYALSLPTAREMGRAALEYFDLLPRPS